MAKSKNTVAILAERIARGIVAEQTLARLTMARDAALIAAHEIFQLGPGRAAAFEAAYNRAMEELAEIYITDAKDDRTLVYAKAKRDQLILSIVGEENFVPFDTAYGEAYVDELRRIRVRNAAEVASQ